MEQGVGSGGDAAAETPSSPVHISPRSADVPEEFTSPVHTNPEPILTVDSPGLDLELEFQHMGLITDLLDF